MWKLPRVSHTLVVNTLATAIGPFLAWDLWWIWRYRYLIARLWHQAWHIVEMRSH